MKWLVRDARADDSLFFHCEAAVHISDRSAYDFQSLVMANSSVILTVMRLTERMKVGGEDHQEYLPLTVCRSHCPS